MDPALPGWADFWCRPSGPGLQTPLSHVHSPLNLPQASRLLGMTKETAPFYRSGQTEGVLHYFGWATTFHLTTTLPFVIPSEAEGSAVLCLGKTATPYTPNCHLDRSVAQWRDLRFLFGRSREIKRAKPWRRPIVPAAQQRTHPPRRAPPRRSSPHKCSYAKLLRWGRHG